MKKVKSMMMTLMMCLMTTLSFGQIDTLTYNDVSNSETRFKGKYDSYLSKDNYIYSIGDTIKISTPSGINGKFVYIQKMDVAGNVYVVGAEATNTYCIVKNNCNDSISNHKFLFQEERPFYVSDTYCY